jgi:hypothetical protein
MTYIDPRTALNDLIKSGVDDHIATRAALLVDNGDARWESADFNGTTVLKDNHGDTILLVIFNYGEDHELTDDGHDVLWS